MEVKQQHRRHSGLFSVPLLSDENACNNTASQELHPTTHFLQGIPIDTFSDLLSIPDPPIRNRRRRLSAPLQETTLHNVPKNTDSNKNAKLLAAKPSRQSLCHVPLPNNKSKPDPPATVTTTDTDTNKAADTMLTLSTKENSLRVSSRWESLNVPESRLSEVPHRDFVPRAPKRSRNSIGPEQQQQQASPRHKTLLEESPFVCVPPAQIDVMSKTLHRVQSLVHSYTSNGTKTAGKDIEALTGYVMTPPTIDPFRPYEAPNKAAIYQRLGPQLKQMDEYKSKQNKLVEQVLDARGEKTRGGMKYFCVSNGHRISSAEYEKRYRVMLEEVHNVQSHAWKDYFQNLGQCSKRPSEVSSHVEQPKVATTDASLPTSKVTSATPFPCREKVSLDPEIAKAEAVLWKTIDQALATYSETVLAVAKRKQLPVS